MALITTRGGEMKTKYGKEIKVGHMFRSTLHLNSKEIQCIKVTESTILLQQTDKGSIPIVLDQNNLDQSYWEICGFKEILK